MIRDKAVWLARRRAWENIKTPEWLARLAPIVIAQIDDELARQETSQ